MKVTECLLRKHVSHPKAHLMLSMLFRAFPCPWGFWLWSEYNSALESEQPSDPTGLLLAFMVSCSSDSELNSARGMGYPNVFMCVTLPNRLIKWLGLGGTLPLIQFQTPAMGRDNFSPDQVAPSCIQAGLGYFQLLWSIHVRTSPASQGRISYL